MRVNYLISPVDIIWANFLFLKEQLGSFPWSKRGEGIREIEIEQIKAERNLVGDKPPPPRC